MHVVVLSEPGGRDWRVALTPASVAQLVDHDHQVTVEKGAGLKAGFADDDYSDAGARVAARPEALAETTDGPTVVVTITASVELAETLNPDQMLVAMLEPTGASAVIETLGQRGITAFSLVLMPRTTRAQSMDVLSSMATVVGYEAALLAASRVPLMFPLLMTAAGTVPPVKALVIGAGVAGLQAIATCKRLGASVEAYDIRPAAAEQIESVGARSIDLQLDTASSESSSGYASQQSTDLNQLQAERLTPHIAQADVVITTAAIPGAQSPELILGEAVEAMRPGSVIVDLAAAQGGNCRLTQVDEEVIHHGVVILGPTDLASRAATTASKMFSTNLTAFLRHLAPDGPPVVDLDDDIIAATLVAGRTTAQADATAETGSGQDRPTETESS